MLSDTSVRVDREWDRLEEVVVGRVADFTITPALVDAAPTLGFLPAGTAGSLAGAEGRRWSQADPEAFATCRAQVDGLAAFLADRGVVVHRPAELTEAEEAVLVELASLSTQMFARDPMIVIGDRVVESSLRMPHRFKERFGLRPLIADLVGRGARHVVVPPGRPVPLDRISGAAGPFLEGGDVMLFGRDVLVGVGEGGYATDDAGLDWLRAELGEERRVHRVRLHPRVLHLDDGLAAVREGLAIVAREQFVDGLPSVIADWDLVEVSMDEALDLLAANVLVLAPGEVVVDSRVPHLAEALSRHDVTVHVLDYDEVTPLGGGFRCSHHPIRRVPT